MYKTKNASIYFSTYSILALLWAFYFFKQFTAVLTRILVICVFFRQNFHNNTKNFFYLIYDSILSYARIPLLSTLYVSLPKTYFNTQILIRIFLFQFFSYAFTTHIFSWVIYRITFVAI